MFRWIRAIFTSIGNFFERKGKKAENTADEAWAKDAESIGLAVELDIEQEEKDLEEMISAVAEMETINEGHRNDLKSVGKQKVDAQKELNGWLILHEEATDKKDAAGIKEAEEEGQKAQEKLTTLTAKYTELEGEIKEDEKQMETFEADLRRQKSHLDELIKKKPELIAKKKKAEQALKAANRLMGLRNRSKSSRIEIIERVVEQEAAEARVAGKLAGVVTEDKGEKARKAAERAEAGTSFRQMLDARKKEKEAQTGAGTTAPQQVEEKKPF